MRNELTGLLGLCLVFALSSCNGENTNNSPSAGNGGSVGNGGNSVTGATGGGATRPTGGNSSGGTSTSIAVGGAAVSGVGGSSAPSTAAGGTSGGSSAATAAGGASNSSTATTQRDAFELSGTWLYLGPWDVMHTLQISDDSMVYTDIGGEWTSHWTIKTYDNSSHHFQLTYVSSTGTRYPAGSSLSGTYVVNGAILTAQLADGFESYPPMLSPGSCTDDQSNRIADCGLYMKE